VLRYAEGAVAGKAVAGKAGKAGKAGEALNK
jgi:hypothetical protein